MSILRAIISFFTGPWRARRAKIRRARYEELKQLISQRHFGGYAGLIVEDPKYDRLDMACFGPPMYGVVKNKDMKWCIFWDRPRMMREIGTGAPLREGETIAVQDHTGRADLWKKTPEEVDEKQALTHQKEQPDGDDEV